MSYVMPHLAFQYILKRTFELLRAKPQYIDEIFEYYDTDDFDVFFKDYKDSIKAWLLSYKIHVIHSYPANFENIPVICVQTLSEVEDVNKEGLGDFYEDNSQLPIDERGEFIHLLHYTFNATVQISIFAGKNNDSVYWLSTIVNWAIIQFKQYLRHLGVNDPVISSSEKTLNRGYSSENVFSRFITVNCYTVNVIRSVTFPRVIDSINTEFFGRPIEEGGDDYPTIDSEIEL